MPMLLLKRFLWLAAVLFAGAQARSSSGDGILVVVEPELQQNYSIFFQNLRGVYERRSLYAKRRLNCHRQGI